MNRFGPARFDGPCISDATQRLAEVALASFDEQISIILDDIYELKQFLCSLDHDYEQRCESLFTSKISHISAFYELVFGDESRVKELRKYLQDLMRP